MFGDQFVGFCYRWRGLRLGSGRWLRREHIDCRGHAPHHFSQSAALPSETDFRQLAPEQIAVEEHKAEKDDEHDGEYFGDHLHS